MAEEKDMEEIKKLPPEERIAKLRELEEKRKQEIEKAKALVKESIEEITRKEEEQFIEREVVREEQERAERAAEAGRHRHRARLSERGVAEPDRRGAAAADEADGLPGEYGTGRAGRRGRPGQGPQGELDRRGGH